MGTNTTSFYLDPPQLIGRPNNDGTVTLTPLELKKLNDFNYAVSKMLQGNLNLANLNTETNEVFTDMEGNITTISATADGLAADISNIEGNITSLSATADGLAADISNIEGNITSLSATANGLAVDVASLENRNTVAINANGLYVTDKNGNVTQLSGDHIKSGTIEGVTLMSDGGGGLLVVIQDGEIIIGSSAYGANIKYDGSKVYFDSCLAPLKIGTLAGMSIESGGNLYINTAYGNGAVYVGNSSGGTDVYLNGNVYINGVLQKKG